MSITANLLPVLDSASERVDHLESLSWSADLTYSELMNLAQYLSSYRIEAGNILFSEGAQSPFIVFLIGGDIELRKSTEVVDPLQPSNSVDSYTVNISGGESAVEYTPTPSQSDYLDSFDQNVLSLGKILTTFHSGSVFGEMSLLDGQPRSATALSSTDSHIFLLTFEAFEQMKVEDPSLALLITLKISSIISRRLRHTTLQWLEVDSSFRWG